METLTHLGDGAVSGAVAGLMLQPLQVIKVAMQVKPIGKDFRSLPKKKPEVTISSGGHLRLQF